jgi:hypothetical protein
MFEINRHGILFIPFLLFPAGAWLEEHSRRLPVRLLALGLIGVTGVCALDVLSRARHTDLRDSRQLGFFLKGVGLAAAP